MRTFAMIIAVTATFRAAYADPKADAKLEVEAGLAAQTAGKYDEAIAHYKRAYDMVPHPEILFDLGQAHRLNGELEAAYDAYMLYLSSDPNGRLSKEAAHWAGELEKQIEARKAAVKSVEPVKPVEPTPTPSATPVAIVTTSSPHSTRLAPWLIAGAALATGGAALGFHLWGNSTYDAAVKESDPDRQISLWHSANTKRYTADGLAVASIGCVAVAVWLFVRGDGEPAIQPTASATQVGVVWAGAW